jgi:hypothetical protein
MTIFIEFNDNSFKSFTGNSERIMEHVKLWLMDKNFVIMFLDDCGDECYVNLNNVKAVTLRTKSK